VFKANVDRIDGNVPCHADCLAALVAPASRLNVMIAIRAAAIPPLAVVKRDVASAVKLVAPPARDLAWRERPIAVPTKPAITQRRSAK
jgi:hypothetical protein